jgi:hypothetical protein
VISIAESPFTTTTAVAVVLLSCSELRRTEEQPSTTSAMVYERVGPVAGAPLAPPVGYLRRQ